MADAKQKEKVKTAVALGYDPNEDGAPKVIASGKGQSTKSLRIRLITLRSHHVNTYSPNSSQNPLMDCRNR